MYVFLYLSFVSFNFYISSYIARLKHSFLSLLLLRLNCYETCYGWGIGFDIIIVLNLGKLLRGHNFTLKFHSINFRLFLRINILLDYTRKYYLYYYFMCQCRVMSFTVIIVLFFCNWLFLKFNSPHKLDSWPTSIQ